MNKLSVIGAGYWGKNIIRNLKELDLLGGVCDLVDTNLDYVKKNYDCYCTKDYKELLQKENIVGVVVATPPETHYILTKEVLRYNKHCLVEKPMTLTRDSALGLVALSDIKNLVLMVDHTFLYTGAVKKIKEILDSGELGKIYYYKSERANLGLLQKNVNVCWDLITHDIYIMEYLFKSEVVSVFAHGKKCISNQEEIAQIILDFANGISANIFANWLQPYKSREIVIIGSDKMLVYDDIQPIEKVIVYNKTVKIGERVEYIDAGKQIQELASGEALKLECRHFYNCCIGKETPMVDGSAGLRTVEILEAIDCSMRENKRIEL